MHLGDGKSGATVGYSRIPVAEAARLSPWRFGETLARSATTARLAALAQGFVA
jgi:hypothetical protein